MVITINEAYWNSPSSKSIIQVAVARKAAVYYIFI
jgi:hypothetical protein